MIRLYFSKVENLSKQFFILLTLALILRILNFSFPSLTADEARIAFRGYTLSRSGVDELGRKLPFVFNSLNDYQLPLTSYISAAGALFFSKSDLGARIPFVIIGLILVILTYKIATLLSTEKHFPLFSSLTVVTSPILIFLSKIPNESIVLTTLLLWLFYLLIQKRINISLIFLAVILLLLTSKFSWFILTPFILYTTFIFRKDLKFKKKLSIALMGLIFPIITFAFFLQIPQARRSLLENNLSLFSDVTITNGINKIRGQGIESGWPKPLEQALVNKSYFIFVGLLHWLSNLQPAIFFSQFDKDRVLGFINMGAFLKITIIPAILGIIFLIKDGKRKLLLYPLIITFPATFIYPRISLELVIASLPFMAFLFAFGFLHLKEKYIKLIILIMIFELSMNFAFLSAQTKLTTDLRPQWIKYLAYKVYQVSLSNKLLFSDDITNDPASFIFWYSNLDPEDAFLDVPYPYKFRQTELGNIKIIGASSTLRNCGPGENVKLVSGNRDLDRIKDLNTPTFTANFSNDRGNVKAYFYKSGICIN